jgi:uncharacterized protein (DUF433 family)
LFFRHPSDHRQIAHLSVRRGQGSECGDCDVQIAFRPIQSFLPSIVNNNSNGIGAQAQTTYPSPYYRAPAIGHNRTRDVLVMSADWSQCQAIESVPERLSGAWVFRGTRIPVTAVFENLEDGLTIDEATALYDGLAREQVQVVLDFAVRSLQKPAASR